MAEEARAGRCVLVENLSTDVGQRKRLLTGITIQAVFKVTESRVSLRGIFIVNYERAGVVTTGNL